MDRMIRGSTTGVFLLAMLGLSAATGQVPLPNETPGAKLPAANKQPVVPGRPQFSALIGLPTDRDLERKLEAIREYIQTGAFREVTQALQDILDHQQDCFVPVPRTGTRTVGWLSARAEANRLLGGLPPKGQQAYEVLSGGRAGALLQEAKNNRDRDKLAEVMRRYLHTRAGTEAAELLGMEHLDRGRYLLAASCFGRLLEKTDLPGMTLFKAAIALRRHGDDVGVQRTWKRLQATFPDGLTVGERRLSLVELKKMLDAPVSNRPQAGTASDWLMFRGTASRTAATAEFPAATELKAAWQTSLAGETTSRTWIDTAINHVQNRGQAVIPGFAPLALAGKAIFRSHGYLQAVDLGSGELAWKSQMNGSLDFPVNPTPPCASIQSQMATWIDAFLSQNPATLIENTAQGTLSSDGQRVFTVEDLAVPPYQINPYYGNAVGIRINGRVMGSDPNSGQFKRNHLLCLELDSGKVAWALGMQDSGPFHEAIFLGPPLPLEGKLYALVEKDLEIRLCCLDPRDGKLLWAQPLAQMKKGIHEDFGRRTWAAPIAHGDGMLLCPTHSGAVVAVDLAMRSLSWAHAYAQAPKQPEQKVMINGRIRVMNRTPYIPRLAANWKNASPIISQGKVLVTAPDASELHCLSLRDGALLWKAPWTAEDQYLAEARDDKVLIVGKQSCRALDLSSGKVLWTAATGMPSGQGVLAGGQYLLPLRDRAIAVIDMANGRIVRRMAMPSDVAPGNLIVHRGRLVSQSPTSFAVLAPGK
ncbi:MAG: hypothetical protein FJ271_16910 [Planctomycetes bacterium]|nr:hypothetical protein [Planctomycetota bacterium]